MPLPFAMDPLHESTSPVRTGVFSMTPTVSLHYERRGSAEAPQKVVLVMGAFATRRHFEQIADFLAATGRVEVLTYDHRGIGKSVSTSADRGASQTSDLLADDAVALLDHVWPKGQQPNSSGLHVYGASMGGMVAQKLALRLLARVPGGHLPLRSLILAVTARCYGLARFVPIGAVRFADGTGLDAHRARRLAAAQVLLARVHPDTASEGPGWPDHGGAVAAALGRRVRRLVVAAQYRGDGGAGHGGRSPLHDVGGNRHVAGLGPPHPRGHRSARRADATGSAAGTGEAAARAHAQLAWRAHGFGEGAGRHLQCGGGAHRGCVSMILRNCVDLLFCTQLRC